MAKRMKKESSSVAANLKGFSAPFGAKPTKKKKKNNVSAPYGEPELFESMVAQAVLNGKDVEEVVRKRGNQWVVHDDDTEVEMGAYGDRETAWEKQRQFRRSKKATKMRPERERQRISQTTHTEKQPKAGVKVKKEKPAGATKKSIRSKKESFEKVKNRIMESMISYVFEQSPVSEESLVWDHFVKRLAREAVMSDQKLKEILQNTAKAEAKLLGKSVGLIKQCLEGTGAFVVQSKELEQDPKSKAILLNFEVGLKESNKKIGFAVKVENGKPLIIFPEESRDVLNTLANQESKLLRAELMHVQETSLNALDDVIKILQNRDIYLKKVQENLDGMLDKMTGLELAMLKHLIKSKQKRAR